MVVLVALSFAVIGCTRDGAKTDTEESQVVPATAKVVAAPTKEVAAPTKEASKAESADEDSSCAGMMAEGNECSGGCDQWDGAANDVLRRKLPDGAKWASLSVEGMTCGGCERRIIANVGKTEGVLKVEADAELGRVRVATLDNAKAVGAAKEKIRSLGYKVVD